MRRTATVRGKVSLESIRKGAFFHEAAYIGGRFLPIASGAPSLAVHSPATGEVVGHIPNLGAAETNQAIAAAEEAQPKWAAAMPRHRARILAKWADLMMQHTDELARLMSAESGKPLGECVGENAYSSQYVEWYAGEAERVYGDFIGGPRPGVRTTVRKKPVGVVGVVTPWNFPSAMVTRSAAAALAAGCSVVLKPSELTPFSALALAELAQHAGVPPGVLNVVPGEAAPIGEALLSSFAVRKLCFTGSTKVGKYLMSRCAETVKRTAMELGGNAPFIVFEDADIDAAVAGAMASKFRNAGQTCVCANRIFVHESIHDVFVAKLKAAVEKLVVGVALNNPAGVTFGPVISRASQQRMGELVAAATTKEHATVVTGGSKPTDPALQGGNFFLPTIITNVKDSSVLCTSEIFGPIAPILTFKDEADVVARANSTKSGLASYFFTNDYRRQWRVSESLKFGMVGINDGVMSSVVAPFGGVKESGVGRDGSKYGIENFLDITYVLHSGL